MCDPLPDYRYALQLAGSDSALNSAFILFAAVLESQSRLWTTSSGALLCFCEARNSVWRPAPTHGGVGVSLSLQVLPMATAAHAVSGGGIIET